MQMGIQLWIYSPAWYMMMWYNLIHLLYTLRNWEYTLGKGKPSSKSSSSGSTPWKINGWFTYSHHPFRNDNHLPNHHFSGSTPWRLTKLVHLQYPSPMKRKESMIWTIHLHDDVPQEPWRFKHHRGDRWSVGDGMNSRTCTKTMA